jgi:hypothetical protein
MPTSTSRRAGALRLGLAAIALIASGLAPGATTGLPPGVPNPCSLLTTAEVVQVAGPLQGKPRPGDFAMGEISCEWTPTQSTRWISLSLSEPGLDALRKRNGGPKPVMLPEFGQGAFVNLDFEGAVDLYAQKGQLVVRLSMPTGPNALEMTKALARKALAHL